jgi:uncharacterized OB-fold protein
MSKEVFRLLPAVGPENEHFWKGGADGELRFLRCDDCRTFVHPPSPVCPECLSRSLRPGAVSGRASVHTYTVNEQPWIPGFDPPYVVAIVDIEEQAGLRLTTNIVNCEIDDVAIGMPVKVCFEEREDGIFIPLFEPDGERGDDRADLGGADEHE